MLTIDQNGKIIKMHSKKVDFVFVYEVKNREIQGISLIGYELMRRGYSVGYVNTWHELDRVNNHKYQAKVAVLFEAYNTSVVDFALSFIDSCDNVVNMQWEQILNDNCLKKGSLYLLEGKANDVFHLSWGEKNKEHLINKCNIPKENVKLVGHVGLDFARAKFKLFYKKREEICKEYRILEDKKIIIFLSTFSTIGRKKLKDEEWDDNRKKSQVEIIKWMKKYADIHPEMTLIYRPHPTECITRELIELCGENIRIIKEESVQQWIVISDLILNWWSTSLADIYAAEKPCIILRPYEIIPRHEYHVFKRAKKVTSYEEFQKVAEGNLDFPIEKEIFEQYYYFDKDELCYKKIVNELMEIYKKPSKLPGDFFPKHRNEGNRFIRNMRLLYGYYKTEILYKLGKKQLKDVRFEMSYHRTMDRENYVSEKNVAKIMEKIGRIILEKEKNVNI